MSGSKILAFRNPGNPHPLEDTLRVEDDRRLLRFSGAGSLLGLAFASWALTVEVMVPPPLRPDPEADPPSARDTVLIKLPGNIHGKIHGKIASRHHAKPGRAGNKAPAPAAARPAENPGWMGVNSITSRNPRSGLGAYDLIGHALGRLDMDKLSELPMLRRTPQSRLAGRKGRQSYEFDLAYAEAGSGCSGDCGPGVLPELAPDGLKRPPSPSLQGPRVSSLDLASAGNARSTASILAVVRAHSPGLRHVYNAFLKQAPGLAGKIRLRFAISPGGDVVEIAALSSTTGDGGFDAAVIAQIRDWRFDPVKAAGNDYVTVPFTFSE